LLESLELMTPEEKLGRRFVCVQLVGFPSFLDKTRPIEYPSPWFIYSVKAYRAALPIGLLQARDAMEEALRQDGEIDYQVYYRIVSHYHEPCMSRELFEEKITRTFPQFNLDVGWLSPEEVEVYRIHSS